jgi:hypothetical protein
MASVQSQRRDDISALFDEPLCSRVRDALAAFEHSFDAVVARPTPGELDELRLATDQLMRAASRVLLQISLEAARLS